MPSIILMIRGFHNSIPLQRLANKWYTNGFLSTTLKSLIFICIIVLLSRCSSSFCVGPSHCGRSIPLHENTCWKNWNAVPAWAYHRNWWRLRKQTSDCIDCLHFWMQCLHCTTPRYLTFVFTSLNVPARNLVKITSLIDHKVIIHFSPQDADIKLVTLWILFHWKGTRMQIISFENVHRTMCRFSSIRRSPSSRAWMDLPRTRFVCADGFCIKACKRGERLSVSSSSKSG